MAAIKVAAMVGCPDLEAPTLASYSGDLRAAFHKLAALGYDGVELMTKKPSRLDGAEIRRLLEEHHLALTGLCSGHIFGEDGLGLVGPELQVNPAALYRLKELIDFIAEFFGPGKMVNIGRSRGVGDPARPVESLAAYAQAFQELADYAQPRQVRLVLEPITQTEVNFIFSTQDGLRMVEQVGRPNFGLMLDTYHMHHQDADLYASFRQALEAGKCWHIHFSDSNRCWPGSGDLNYERIVQALNENGYQGYVSTEIRPWPDPDTSAASSIASIRRYIPAT